MLRGEFCGMRLRYQTIIDNPKRLISLTTLRKEEFIKLSESMEHEWQQYISHFTLEGKARKRMSFVRENSTLPQAEDRLLFILYYFKTYPLQEAMASTFDMTQAQVSIWVSRLSKLLKQALHKQDCLPVRKSEQLKRVLANEKTVIIDGTERIIQRPADAEVQKDYYSGKKRIILSRTT